MAFLILLCYNINVYHVPSFVKLWGMIPFKKCFLLGKKRWAFHLLPFYPAPFLFYDTLWYFGDHGVLPSKTSSPGCPTEQALPPRAPCVHRPHPPVQLLPAWGWAAASCSGADWIHTRVHMCSQKAKFGARFYMQVAKIWVTSLIQWRFSLSLIISKRKKVFKKLFYIRGRIQTPICLILWSMPLNTRPFSFYRHILDFLICL